MPNANKPGQPRKDELKIEIRRMHDEDNLSFKEIGSRVRLTRQGAMYHYHTPKDLSTGKSIDKTIDV